MRNNLYIWNDLETNSIIISGIEFKDLIKSLIKYKGIYLLKHKYDNAKFDKISNFEYISKEDLYIFESENIYDYGDFVFVDYSIKKPTLMKQTIAELLYFSHTGKPFDKIQFIELKNDFLFWSHDDGYFLRIFYNSLSQLLLFLKNILNHYQFNILNTISHVNKAIIIMENTFKEEIKTLNIDSISKKLNNIPF